MPTSKHLLIDLTQKTAPATEAPLAPGTSISAQGVTLKADSLSFFVGNQPWIPIAGEFHNARYPHAEWRDELLKMKAGGINLVSTYVFWIHHEEVRGNFDWSGDRSLREFLKLCQETGLKAIVRLGPWCHGEVRNGGFPDWVQHAGSEWGEGGPKLRGLNPDFMALVKPLYREIALQLEGMLWKDGGPVIAIQLDNECNGPEYLLTLKQMAHEAGIDVPFYTMTGWDKVEIPQAGLMPLFGAYVDGFWGGTPEKYRKGFVFSKVRDDGDLGSQMENIHPARNEHMESFPFACCEIGPGMMSSYAKRVVVDPDDAAAMALVKLGCGNNMPGYYMYHGGVNPEGKLTTLQEEQPNAMPIKDYDFKTCLGAAGQVRPQYHLLRQQHTFLNSFGHLLARMPAYFPVAIPKDLGDTETFRWSFRADEKGSGFIFFNNRQPVVPLPERPAVQLEIKTATSSKIVPRTPVSIPSGSYGIWPVGLDCDGVLLDYATVQPLARVEDEGGGAVYFFCAVEGVRAELALHGQEPQTVAPGLSVALKSKNAAGKTVSFVVLAPDQGRSFYLETFAGRRHAILCRAAVFADEPRLRLQSENATDFQISIFPPLSAVRISESQIQGVREGLFAHFDLQVKPSPLPEAGIDQVKPADPEAMSLKGTEEATWNAAAVYKLALPAAAGGRRVILNIHYLGDAARLYVGEKLFLDDFYNGAPMPVPLWRIPQADWSKLSLKVLPYSDGLAERLSDETRRKVSEAKARNALGAIVLTLSEQQEIQVEG